MEDCTHGHKPPLPMPNLCRLVEILLRNARRRKQCFSNCETLQRKCSTEEGSSSDGSVWQTPPESPTEAVPEHDFQEPYPRFQGRTPEQVSLAELTAEFRALTVAQERESRRHLGLETSPPQAPVQRWHRLNPGDAQFFGLVPSEMRMTAFSEEPLAQQNAAAVSEQGVNSVAHGENGAVTGPDQADDETRHTELAVFPEETPVQERLSSDTRSWEWVTSSSHEPAAASAAESNIDRRLSEDQDNAARLMGRPLLKAEVSPASGLSSTPPAVPVQMTQLMWVRLANNQMVLAQVPVVSQAPAGVLAPMTAHLGSSLTTPAPVHMGLSLGTPASAHMGSSLVTPASAHMGSSLGTPASAHIGSSLATPASAHMGSNLTTPASAHMGLSLGTPAPAHMGSSLATPASAHIGSSLATPASAHMGLSLATPAPAHMGSSLATPASAYIGSSLATPAPAHVNSTPSAAPVLPQAPAKPSWTALAAVSPEEHKQMIGERLYSQIRQMYPGLTQKITGMLLELDNKVLLQMLESREMLRSCVHEAAKVLQQRVLKSPRVTTEMLEPFPAKQQKQILGEYLFRQVEQLHPNLAGKITGMLLALDNQDLLQLLDDPHRLRSKVEEAITVLIHAFQGGHYPAKDASGKQSLAGDLVGTDFAGMDEAGTESFSGHLSERRSQGGLPTDFAERDFTGTDLAGTKFPGTVLERTDLPATQSFSGDLSKRRSQIGNPSGEQPLTDDNFGKEPLLLSESVAPQQAAQEGVLVESDQESWQAAGILGEWSLYTSDSGNELSNEDVSKIQSMVKGILEPLSATGDVGPNHVPAEDFPGAGPSATDSGGKPSLTDDDVEPHSPTSSVVQTQSVPETIPGRQLLKDEVLETQSLTDGIYDTSQARELPTEPDLAMSSHNNVPERIPMDDLKTQSLNGDVWVTLSQTRNLHKEQPLPDAVPEKLLPVGSFSEKQLTEDALDDQLRRDILDQQPETENTPKTLSLMTDISGRQPATEVGDIWRQSVLVETQTLSGSTPETPSQTLDNMQRKSQSAEVLSPDLASPASPVASQQQKEALRELLWPVVERMYPGFGREICDIMLTGDLGALYLVMQQPDNLRVRVGEAVSVLQAHRAQQIAEHDLALQSLHWQQQKQMLRERLYWAVQGVYPQLAGQITELLLAREGREVEEMLQVPQMLQYRVGEAVMSLQAQLLNTPLTTDILNLFPQPMQKQMLADRLLPLVQSYHPDQAAALTSILLNLENWQLLQVLGSPQVLQDTVDSAVHVLQRMQTVGGQGWNTAEMEKNEERSAQSVDGRETGVVCREPDHADGEDGSPQEQPPHHTNINTAHPPCAESTADKECRHSDGTSQPATPNLCEDSLLKQDAVSFASGNDPTGNQWDQAHIMPGDDSPEPQGEERRSVEAEDSFYALSKVGERSQCGDAHAVSSSGQAAQESGVHLTPADLMQCGTYAQQGVSMDVFETMAYLQNQKQVLGERLYWAVQALYPRLAGQITGLLLSRGGREVEEMLQVPQVLQYRVEEAVRSLQAQVDNTPLTADSLHLLPQSMQKQVLMERLYAQVERLQPGAAGKITGVLMDLDNAELLEVLNTPNVLKKRVDEALAMLYLCHGGVDDNRKEETPCGLQERATVPSPQSAAVPSSDCAETAAAWPSHEENQSLQNTLSWGVTDTSSAQIMFSPDRPC